MADIKVERKSGVSWIWWIIGLIILALIIWWIVASFGHDRNTAAPAAVAPAATAPPAAAPVAPAATPSPAATASTIPVADILANPGNWTGKTVSGTAQVASVPTDRGFWLESNGQRIFAVLNDQPQEQPVDINPGQTVQLTNARVLTSATDVQGTLSSQTTSTIQGQPAFLNVDEQNVTVSQMANTQTGTTGAAPGAGTIPPGTMGP
ncbi:MAG TPA: hypothetical protein VFL93_10710 [Longimicrobiaceae bacterium]|nr:hypothetical protein [Longimicrobiaceae bacterium]